MDGECQNTSSVEATFKPAFEEIARRKESTKGCAWEETTYFGQTSSCVRIPYVNPTQRFALVSMGTAVLAPIPADRTRPALRVYGAFSSREEAREHAEDVRAVDAECSLVLLTLHEWVLMPQDDATRLDPEANARRREALLEEHHARRANAEDTFRRRVETRDGAGPTTVTPPEEDGDDAETREAEDLVYKPLRRLRAGAEVRGQNYVALCAIPNADTGECLVKVLGCFDTDADADMWTKGVASRRVTEDDIHVGRTCEWVYPNGRAESTLGPRYRVDELQRIMDASDRNPKAVQDYKTWKAEQEVQRRSTASAEAKEDTRGEE